jgi:hypothetical protein
MFKVPNWNLEARALRLDHAPIKGSLAQFLYINRLPMGWCLRSFTTAEGNNVQRIAAWR